MPASCGHIAPTVVATGLCTACHARSHPGIRTAPVRLSRARKRDLLLKDQGGVCAICFDEPATRRLALDHDHLGGSERGLLCTRCNMGLGYFRDSQVILGSAIDYLERWQRTVILPTEEGL